MRAMERRGHSVVWPPFSTGDLPVRQLLDCDLVHCYLFGGGHADLAKLKALQRQGVAVSFDNDDFQAAAPVVSRRQAPHHLGSGVTAQRAFAATVKAARLADLVTTPSEVVADLYREAGVRHVVRIENHLAAAPFPARPRHRGIVVGWVAALEHTSDVQALGLGEILSRLLAAHPALHVMSVGVRLPLQSERYTHIRNVPFEELWRVTASFDIGIAPLTDTPFNRARSNVKLKEYAAGGTPWLASNHGPYRDLGPAQGGRLVASDGWLHALDQLIRQRLVRRRLARRARAWAASQTIDRAAEVWEREFLAAIERRRNAG
jgi:glycosyltransferase involved in cell wall biosynthesis